LPSLFGAAGSDKGKQMKSALQKLGELSEVSKNYPSVVPLIGAVSLVGPITTSPVGALVVQVPRRFASITSSNAVSG
jgi:hypothetical protein